MADAFERTEEQVVAGRHSDGAEKSVDEGSISTEGEQLNESAAKSKGSSKDLTRTRSGISGEQAEADFQELQREFTSVSRASRRSSKPANNADPEKTASDSPDEESHFDLETALRGDLDSQHQASIKNKHIGAYWDGLTVRGFGDRANYVSTFPDAFVNFFDYITPVMNKGNAGLIYQGRIPRPTKGTNAIISCPLRSSYCLMVDTATRKRTKNLSHLIMKVSTVRKDTSVDIVDAPTPNPGPGHHQDHYCG